VRIFYDTEFIERGPDLPIQLVSIGMVREDGQELYRINADMSLPTIYRMDWLRKNVLPHLPVKVEGEAGGQAILVWDAEHPDYAKVKPRQDIRDDVYDFVIGGLATEPVPDPELWAYYGAYDHVVLTQLFGSMAELPLGFPMMTMDLVQPMAGMDVTDIPGIAIQQGNEHHALDDARWTRDVYNWMIAYQRDAE
jgi:hypothetical protein